MDAAKCQTTVDPADPAICSSKSVLKCCREFELCKWVAHQNGQKGLAPTCSDTAELLCHRMFHSDRCQIPNRICNGLGHGACVGAYFWADSPTVKHHRLLNLKPRLRAPLAGFGAIHERFLVAHQTFADSQMGVHQVAPFWGPRDQINVFQAFMLRPSFWHRKRAIDVFFRQPFSGAGRTFLNSIASSD